MIKSGSLGHSKVDQITIDSPVNQKVIEKKLINVDLFNLLYKTFYKPL